MDRLQVRADITTEKLVEIERQISDALFQIMVLYDDGFDQSFFGKYIFSGLFWVLRAACFYLIYLAVSFIVAPRSSCNFLVFDLILIALAVAILWIFRDKNAFYEKRKPGRHRFFQRICRWRAAIMLKVARKQVPFVAEYDVRGNLVVYYRVKGEQATQVWSRNLQGFFQPLKDCVLFYGDAKKPRPKALMLGQADAALIEHLQRAGLKSMD